jgi:hypothetical protein
MMMGTDVWQLLQAVGAVATAIGVAVAAIQLQLQKGQQRTDFEDRLTEQYRDIMAQLPLEALLEDRELDGERWRVALHAFYRYFDLTNEQLFLFRHGRISSDTWENWKEGIQENMRRNSFRSAWSEIAAAMPDSFDELRELVPPLPRTATLRQPTSIVSDDASSRTINGANRAEEA